MQIGDFAIGNARLNFFVVDIRPCMTLALLGRGTMGKDAEESVEARSAWNSLDAERLGHSGVGGEPRHPGDDAGGSETRRPCHRGPLGAGP